MTEPYLYEHEMLDTERGAPPRFYGIYGNGEVINMIQNVQQAKKTQKTSKGKNKEGQLVEPEEDSNTKFPRNFVPGDKFYLFMDLFKGQFKIYDNDENLIAH